MKEIVDKIREGDEKEIARCISLIEKNSENSSHILKEIFPYTGRAIRIGITGPPGVGKSTLIDKLTLLLIEKDKSVGIIALDPVSPFSGGALLGDRIRMSDLNLENKVFIRSMALREGKGVSRFALDAADILDASGKDYIIIETVGIGQSEIEIAYLTDCTILVLSPEAGDGIQAMKAGILETSDLIVINKSDRPGAEELKKDIIFAFNLSGKEAEVILTNSLKGEGISELLEKIEEFIIKAKNLEKFEKRRKEIIKERIKKLIFSKIEEKIMEKISENDFIEKMANYVYNLKFSTHEVANEFIKKFLGG